METVTDYTESLELFRDVESPALVQAVRDSLAYENRALQWENDFLKANRPKWYEDKTLWFALGVGLAVAAGAN